MTLCTGCRDLCPGGHYFVSIARSYFPYSFTSSQTCKSKLPQKKRYSKHWKSILPIAGDGGVLWAMYAVAPSAYEVTFSPQNGAEFDALMYEAELAEPAAISRQEHSLTAA